jgi:hypothetical protein
LWEQAHLSFTPKLHEHAADKVECLVGIADRLEYDLEHLHQMSKKKNNITSRIKNKNQKALSHGKASE